MHKDYFVFNGDNIHMKAGQPAAGAQLDELQKVLWHRFNLIFFISKEELSGVTSTSQLLTIKQRGEYFV